MPEDPIVTHRRILVSKEREAFIALNGSPLSADLHRQWWTTYINLHQFRVANSEIDFIPHPIDPSQQTPYGCDVCGRPAKHRHWSKVHVFAVCDACGRHSERKEG